MSNGNGNAAGCEVAAATYTNSAECEVMPERPILTLGVVARMFKISPLALRLFELRGLIRRHRAGNVRLFSWFDCERIALLVKARNAGLAVREFAAVLSAMDEQASDKVADAGRLQCLSVIHTLETHKQSVSNVLEELYRIDWELSERLGVEGCLESGESVDSL